MKFIWDLTELKQIAAYIWLDADFLAKLSIGHILIPALIALLQLKLLT